jgi:hypothetical protein
MAAAAVLEAGGLIARASGRLPLYSPPFFPSVRAGGAIPMPVPSTLPPSAVTIKAGDGEREMALDWPVGMPLASLASGMLGSDTIPALGVLVTPFDPGPSEGSVGVTPFSTPLPLSLPERVAFSTSSIFGLLQIHLEDMRVLDEIL